MREKNSAELRTFLVQENEFLKLPLTKLASIGFYYERVFCENILVKNIPFSGLLDITLIAYVFFRLLKYRQDSSLRFHAKIAIKQREGEETGKNRARHSRANSANESENAVEARSINPEEKRDIYRRYKTQAINR